MSKFASEKHRDEVLHALAWAIVRLFPGAEELKKVLEKNDRDKADEWYPNKYPDM